MLAATTAAADDPAADWEAVPTIVREPQDDAPRRIEMLQKASATKRLRGRLRPISSKELSRLRDKTLDEVLPLRDIETIVVHDPGRNSRHPFDATDERLLKLYRTAVVEPIPDDYHVAPWTVLSLKLRNSDRPSRLWLMLAGVGRLERADGSSIPIRYSLDDQP